MGNDTKYPETPEQYVALFGEAELKYQQKSALVGQVLHHVKEFLKLKVNNSARIVFELDLDEHLRRKYNKLLAPTPAIVRMRVSRIAGARDREIRIEDEKPPRGVHCWEPGPDGVELMRCEWRIADAYQETSAANISWGELHHPCYGGAEHRRIWEFFEKNYGVDMQPYYSRMPHVTAIRAHVVLREPLGVLAVLEGDSSWVTVRERCINGYEAVRQVSHPSVLEP